MMKMYTSNSESCVQFFCFLFPSPAAVLLLDLFSYMFLFFIAASYQLSLRFLSGPNHVLYGP